MSVKILIGDVFTRLAELPDDSVDCVVTSPPYWGLRDYGTATWVGGDPECDHLAPMPGGVMASGRAQYDNGLTQEAIAANVAARRQQYRGACRRCGAERVDSQLGLEPTLGEHLAAMVAVFEEIKRVLKPTGTLWLNYGDCYATSPNGRSAADTKAAGGDDRTFRDKPFSTIGGALKAKDLCMVPNRLAIALQEAGWWVRSEIIWAKPNPMPESITDRPATSHEKIFLLTKRLRYFYNANAVRQGRTSDEDANTFRGGAYCGGDTDNGTTGKRKVRGNQRRDSFKRGESKRGVAHIGQNMGTHRPDREDVAYPRGEGRNLRNYEPAPVQVWEVATRPFKDAHFATFPPELAERCLRAGCPPGGAVLDPFGGAGTTGLVADRMGLDCTLIELNPAYAEIARKRIASDAGLLAQVETVTGVVEPEPPILLIAGGCA
mgnify:CR=1 FL=1